MAGYDPKRPRPSAPADEPAPVEALMDPAEPAEPPDATEPAEATGRAEPSGREPTAPAPGPSTRHGSGPNAPSANGPGPISSVPATTRSGLPTGVIVASVVGVVLILVLLLRRRRS